LQSILGVAAVSKDTQAHAKKFRRCATIERFKCRAVSLPGADKRLCQPRTIFSGAAGLEHIGGGRGGFGHLQVMADALVLDNARNQTDFACTV